MFARLPSAEALGYRQSSLRDVGQDARLPSAEALGYRQSSLRDVARDARSLGPLVPWSLGPLVLQFWLSAFQSGIIPA
jgi:hypothetical protein